MLHIIDPRESAQLEKFCALSPVLQPAIVRRGQADHHLSLTNQAGEISARCSLWIKQTPTLPQQKLGVLGHYAAHDKDAAQELLQQACTLLAANGCTMVVGPMDGNTWQRYRLVTERGNEPAFFLEPENPEDWAQHFLANGFATCAEYFSTVTNDLQKSDPNIATKAVHFAQLGITIRAARAAEFNAELARIYSVAARAFCHNFLYMPINQAEFIALYEPLKNFLQPEIVLLAERANNCVGFLFALPNVAQSLRGQAIDTLIVKTVAVLPEADYVGLGGLLVARAHEIGATLGYQRAIHALMHEGNRSRGISKHYSEPLRRYALFGKAL